MQISVDCLQLALPKNANTDLFKSEATFPAWLQRIG